MLFSEDDSYLYTVASEMLTAFGSKQTHAIGAMDCKYHFRLSGSTAC